MREIKFRMWDGHRWNYFALNNIAIYIDLFQKHLLNGDEPYLYTGLHDKNGKEIYERNILQIWMEGDKQIRPYVIESLRSFYADLDTTDSYMRISDFELIGNIYENAELLQPQEAHT